LPVVVGRSGRAVPDGPVGDELPVRDGEPVAGVLEGEEAVSPEDDGVGAADRDLEDVAGIPDDRQRDADGLAAAFDAQHDRFRVDVVAVPLAAFGPSVGRQPEPLAAGVLAVRAGVVVDGVGGVVLTDGLALATRRPRTTPSYSASNVRYSTTAPGRTRSDAPASGPAMHTPVDCVHSDSVSRSYITRSSAASFWDTPNVRTSGSDSAAASAGSVPAAGRRS
jgi:hypothetical protein